MNARCQFFCLILFLKTPFVSLNIFVLCFQSLSSVEGLVTKDEVIHEITFEEPYFDKTTNMQQIVAQTAPNTRGNLSLLWTLKGGHSAWKPTQQAFLSLWWTYGQTFSTSRTQIFRSRAGSVQYQIGSSLALFVNTRSANNSIWVRSLYRIIKELDLEQFIHWLNSTKQQQ